MAAKEGLGLEITELKLGLPGSGTVAQKAEKKRVFSEMEDEAADDGNGCSGGGGGGQKSRKNQVVGWPPVCSHRKKNLEASKMYVKVSMDGAPFLRKIDLGVHSGYSDLACAMEKLFACSGIGEAMKDEESRSELMPIYEDKDGDWMLVGDVPWQMFMETCKRLRIMKKSEAKGFGLHLKGASKDQD